MFPYIIFSIGIIIVCLFIYLYSTKFKGKIGEWKTKRFLKKISKNNAYLINDVIIPSRNNSINSQIDHILFSKKGIFVIEVKNYNGEIYGDDINQEWTQVLNFGKNKYHFNSPVIQNNTHVKNLSNILQNKYIIKSIVIFVKGNIKHISSNYVYSYYTFKKMYKSIEDIYSFDDIKCAYEVIKQYKDNPIETNKEHIKNIQNNILNNDKYKCPNCGKVLVLKSGKYGEFYACPNYPKCKYTINKNKLNQK